jgi:hypothetical protein
VTAISVAAMPASQSVPPAQNQAAKTATTIKPGSRSAFNAMFSDASPDHEEAKKDEQADHSTVSLAIFVPSPPKVLLPLTFTSMGDQQTPSAPSGNLPGQSADLTLDTVDLHPPDAAAKAPVDELAFAAKLIETAAPAQAPAATPAPVPTALAQTSAPASAPPPVDQKVQTPPRASAIPQSQPDAPKPVPAAPERHSSSEASITQQYPAPQTPAMDATPSSLAPRNVAATPQTPAIDHIAQPLEHSQSSPLNQITLRVANADQSSASIRMVERSGELHVAIRASDSQLADSLRGNVDQLTSRLNSNGWGTEVWKPAAIAPAVRAQSSSQEMPQGQPGSRQQNGERSNPGQQNNKQKYPAWVEEFYANNE